MICLTLTFSFFVCKVGGKMTVRGVVSDCTVRILREYCITLLRNGLLLLAAILSD